MISTTWERTDFEADAQALQRPGGDALTLVDQTEQDVLGPDVVVVEEPRLFLSEDHDSPGPVGESFKHALCTSINLWRSGCPGASRSIAAGGLPTPGESPDRSHRPISASSVEPT